MKKKFNGSIIGNGKDPESKLFFFSLPYPSSPPAFSLHSFSSSIVCIFLFNTKISSAHRSISTKSVTFPTKSKEKENKKEI